MARINPPAKQPWFGQFLNTILSRRYGKPFPAVALLGHNPSYPFAYAIFSNNFGLGKTLLRREIKVLATQLVAELNGCAFCIDLGQRFAQDEKLNLEKIRFVLEFETHQVFTALERAALRYVFEATQVGARVSDKTFQELKKYFSEREILELTVAVATENFYNRLNAPLEIESQGLCAIPNAKKPGLA
jgi:alkylhydroperoxidase family enzyme